MEKNGSSNFNIGLPVSILLFLVSTAIIVLSSIEFKLIYATWSSSYYFTLGPTQITSGVLLVVTSIFGIYVYTGGIKSSGIYGMHLIFLLLSIIFSFGVGIFAVVGAAMKGPITKAIGCDTKSTGILNLWTGIDEYYKLAGSMMCSPLCVCKIKNSTIDEYTNNRFAYSFLDQIENNTDYEITNDDIEFKFEDCPEESQKLIENLYKSNPNTTMKDIDFSKFHKYFKRVEERLHCSGWCTTSYTNQFTLRKQKMYKYIFSDMNKEVPSYPGCLMRLLWFLHIFTSILGAFLLLCGVLCTVCLLITSNIMGLSDDQQYADNTDNKVETYNP